MRNARLYDKVSIRYRYRAPVYSYGTDATRPILEDYMARSSWTAIYTDVEQRFMRARRYKLFFLLKAIVQHTDPFGLSYPGDDLLKELTGYGTQLQLNEALQFLVDGEYLKIWESWNPRRRAWERDFQVSPDVMYIREDLMPYCIRLWNTGERDFDAEKSIVIKLNGQPESESKNQPESTTRLSTHHHHPSKSTLKGYDARTEEDPAALQEKQPKQRRRREQGKAHATQKEFAHAGPPAATKPDLRKYQSPLKNMDDEQLAIDLKLSIRMRMSQARMLIATYGREQVGLASRAVAEAMADGRSTNPPGLLTAILRRSAISLEDRTLYPSLQEKLRQQNALLEDDETRLSD